MIVQARKVCEHHGAPVSGMRVLIDDMLTRLKLAVTAMAVALAHDDGRWSDESAVAERLIAGHLNRSEILSGYTKPATGAKTQLDYCVTPYGGVAVTGASVCSTIAARMAAARSRRLVALAYT